jgi:hypothetical protein
VTDDGTLTPPGGAPTITLEELRRSARPMSVLERVEKAALGLVEMSPEELTAAKLYLAKTAADLKSIEVNETHTVRQISDADLDRRIAELLARAGQADAADAAERAGTTH